VDALATRLTSSLVLQHNAAVPSASAIQQAGAPSSSRAGAKAGAILEAGALAGSEAEEEQQQEEEEAGVDTAGGCCGRLGSWPLCVHIHHACWAAQRTGHMCCAAAGMQSWRSAADVLPMAALLFDPVALRYLWYASVHALYRRCC
jgi:hypothetical protein